MSEVWLLAAALPLCENGRKKDGKGTTNMALDVRGRNGRVQSSTNLSSSSIYASILRINPLMELRFA